IEGLVFKDMIEIGLCDTVGEDQQFFCVGPPIFTECCDRLCGRGVRESRRRAALKALEPDDFAAANVSERVADRRKTGGERLGELLVGKLRRSVKRAVVGPVVVVEKLAGNFGGHGSLLVSLKREKSGFLARPHRSGMTDLRSEAWPGD